jgi:lipoprotein-anchoring transpeptidase ErfK/SrfK
MRRTRLLSLAIALVLISAVTAAFWPHKGTTVAEAASPTTTSSTTSTTIPSHGFEAAHAQVAEVPLFDSPEATESTDSMSNPTWEGVPLVFLVKQHGPPGWLQVQISRRPNETLAWIHESDVFLSDAPNRIVVQREARTLTVYQGTSDTELFQAPVAVGAPRTPTPLGNFFVDIRIKLLRPTGAYGPYELSVAGFSDVLHSFGGGVGQIAIHGTNHPELIGQFVSNGCIRMNNDDVTSLAPLAPEGTPVQVVE